MCKPLIHALYRFACVISRPLGFVESERIGLPLSRATEAAEDTWASVAQVFKVLAHLLNSLGKQYTRETQKGKEAVRLNHF